MKFYRILAITFFTYVLISCGGAEERKSVYMNKAKASIEAGDFDKARIELKNVLQIDPKYAEAYYQMGTVHESLKKYKKAYGMYLKVKELDSNHLDARARLGRIYLLLANDLEKSKEEMEFILEKEANHSGGMLLQAALLSKGGDKSGAIDIAKKVLLNDSENIDGVVFLTSLHVQNKAYSKAIKVLDDALEKNHNNGQLSRLLAIVLTTNNDSERAEKIYKQILGANPDNLSNYYMLASFYNKLGEHDKAENILRASIKNMPNDNKRYLALVQHVKKSHGGEKAINELRKIINKNKNEGEFVLALGELLTIVGDKEEALEVYSKAVAEFSDESTGVRARVALAAIKISEKDYAGAEAIIEDAIKISPNNPRVNLLNSQLALNNKNAEKAIISLRLVMKETPENMNVYFLLAKAYELENNKEQIINTLNAAFENNKMNPAGLLILAKYYLSADMNKAEKVIDTYNVIKPHDYEGLSIKSAILNKKQSYDEGYKIANHLIDLFPSKPNGYLQSTAFLRAHDKNNKAISVLEAGFTKVADNQKILMLLTSLQVSQKQFGAAQKRIETGLQSAPDDAHLLMLDAKITLAKGDYKKAISKFETITIEHANIEDSYLLLAQLYLNDKDKKREKVVLLRGEKNLPASVKIPLRLAAFYQREKEYNSAINIYRDLSKLYPENLIVVNNLASMLLDYGNDKEDLALAVKLSKQLETSPQPAFVDTVGWAHYHNKKFDSAITFLSQVVEKAPDVNVFNYHLGMAYKKAGDAIQAKKYLKKSINGKREFGKRKVVEKELDDL